MIILIHLIIKTDFLCAAKENEANIRQLMVDLINPDTELMKNEGFNLSNQEHVHIDIIRSMFDDKMAAILSGAGGGGKLPVMYSYSRST